jgi:hypothetical protein
VNLKTLDDEQLQLSLDAAVVDVGTRTSDGIAILAEMAERSFELTSGHGSLFMYCRKKYGFSKGTAWRWSEAAMAAQRDEGVIARLRDGRLSLCVAAKLAKYPELLKIADGMSQEEAEQRVADLVPRKARRDILPPLRQDFAPQGVDGPLSLKLQRDAVSAEGDREVALKLQQDTVSAEGNGPLSLELHSTPGSAEASAKVDEQVSRPIEGGRDLQLPQSEVVDAASQPRKQRFHADISEPTLAHAHRLRELMPDELG